MKLARSRIPIEHLSATSLAKAVSCPEAWRRRYLLHEREGFGVDRFVGSVDHKTVEAFMADKMETGTTWTPELLESAYLYTWEDELMRSADHGEEPSWGLQNPAALQEQGQLMVHTYVDQAAASVDPIAVEQKFEEKLPGVPVPLIGYIDIETKDRVVERKTSKTKVGQPRPGWRFQAKIYQLAVRKPVEWHVTTRQVTPQILTGMTLHPGDADITVQQVQQIYTMLDGYWLKYGQNSPWPTLGIHHEWLCSKCQHGPSLISDCVAWRP